VNVKKNWDLNLNGHLMLRERKDLKKGIYYLMRKNENENEIESRDRWDDQNEEDFVA